MPLPRSFSYDASLAGQPGSKPETRMYEIAVCATSRQCCTQVCPPSLRTTDRSGLATLARLLLGRAGSAYPGHARNAVDAAWSSCDGDDLPSELRVQRASILRSWSWCCGCTREPRWDLRSVASAPSSG